MSKIIKIHENLHKIPENSILLKNNRVYLTIGRHRVSLENGRFRSDPDRVCVGVAQLDRNGNPTGMFYANETYHIYCCEGEIPLPPDRADSLTIGPRILFENVCEKYDLIKILNDVFGKQDTNLILDLSMYMITERTAVFQRFPLWAKRNLLFSSEIRSDSYVSNFLENSLSYSKIKLFLSSWGKRHINSGGVYFCYDSTNVNSQAEGVYIVQKGHAKDDPSLPQINTDYVIRQEDGLPLIFSDFPGSIVDMHEAKQIIKFLSEISEETPITVICDRGYISEENIDDMRENGISYILMLKSNSKDYKYLMETYFDQLDNKFDKYIPEYNSYAMTVKHKLFSKGKENYFHLILNKKTEPKQLNVLAGEINNRTKLIHSYINRKKPVCEKELNDLSKWHDLDVKESGTLILEDKRSKSGNVTVPAYIINSCKESNNKIEKYLKRCGFYIIVSSDNINYIEALKAYSKRDIIEKTFMVLKSSLGMDKFGVSSENRMHGKSLIWFIASIIYSIIFSSTKSLRVKDTKNFTFNSMIERIKGIVADRDFKIKKYQRRYRLDSKQKKDF